MLSKRYPVKKKTIEHLHEILNNINSSLSHLITSDKVDWIDDSTKIYFLEKINDMKAIIGTTELNVLDNMDEFYKHVR